MRTAWLFPGHGAQYVGMGRALRRSTSSDPLWLARAETISGLPLQSCLDRGPLTELTRPSVLEPLLAALSGAYVDWLREQGAAPRAVAGYSAGELGAMYAGGVLDAETCLRVACMRGNILETAASESPGGMMSVSGLDLASLLACADSARDSGFIELAACNSPLHMTLSGEQAALDRAASHVTAAGATVGNIAAAGPWHTQLLDPARDALKAELAAVPFAEAQVPVWTGAAGTWTTAPAQLKAALSESLCSTIRWVSVVEGLLKTCDDFLEVGPGHVLWGLLGQFRLPSGTRRKFVERAGASRLDPSTLLRVAR